MVSLHKMYVLKKILITKGKNVMDGWSWVVWSLPEVGIDSHIQTGAASLNNVHRRRSKRKLNNSQKKRSSRQTDVGSSICTTAALQSELTAHLCVHSTPHDAINCWCWPGGLRQTSSLKLAGFAKGVLIRKLALIQFWGALAWKSLGTPELTDQLIHPKWRQR